MSRAPTLTSEDDTPPPRASSTPEPSSATTEADMARYGIARIPVDYFHVGGFRYTTLAEAVAQAKRASEVDREAQ